VFRITLPAFLRGTAKVLVATVRIVAGDNLGSGFAPALRTSDDEEYMYLY
jgi:hypothetical protein